MIPAINSAQYLMQDSQNRFDVAAHNLANINTEGFKPLRADGSDGDSDLASQIVDSMTAANSYKLGAAMIRTNDEMLGTLVNIKA